MHKDKSYNNDEDLKTITVKGEFGRDIYKIKHNNVYIICYDKSHSIDVTHWAMMCNSILYELVATKDGVIYKNSVLSEYNDISKITFCGLTKLEDKEIDVMAKELATHYVNEKYVVFENNCQNFVRHLADFVTTKKYEIQKSSSNIIEFGLVIFGGLMAYSMYLISRK